MPKSQSAYTAPKYDADSVLWRLETKYLAKVYDAEIHKDKHSRRELEHWQGLLTGVQKLRSLENLENMVTFEDGVVVLHLGTGLPKQLVMDLVEEVNKINEEVSRKQISPIPSRRFTVPYGDMDMP